MLIPLMDLLNNIAPARLLNLQERAPNIIHMIEQISKMEVERIKLRSEVCGLIAMADLLHRGILSNSSIAGVNSRK